MTRPGRIPAQAGFEPRIFRFRGGRLNHQDNEAVRDEEPVMNMFCEFGEESEICYRSVKIQIFTAKSGVLEEGSFSASLKDRSEERKQIVKTASGREIGRKSTWLER